MKFVMSLILNIFQSLTISDKRLFKETMKIFSLSLISLSNVNKTLKEKNTVDFVKVLFLKKIFF